MTKQVTIMTMLVAMLFAVAACDNGGGDRAMDESGSDMTSGSDRGDAMSDGGMSDEGSGAMNDSGTMGGGDAMAGGAKAVATLEATEGNNAKGTVLFSKADGGVKAKADVTNLASGKHGFHVHAKGDCSAPDASSAGGHFNPEGVDHAGPTDSGHHMGDLGNIKADDSGKASMTQTFDFLKLSGDNSIVGKAVVVHAGADDLTSQPSGAAGPRVACGVIEKSGASSGGSMGGGSGSGDAMSGGGMSDSDSGGSGSGY